MHMLIIWPMNLSIDGGSKRGMCQKIFPHLHKPINTKTRKENVATYYDLNLAKHLGGRGACGVTSNTFQQNGVLAVPTNPEIKTQFRRHDLCHDPHPGCPNSTLWLFPLVQESAIGGGLLSCGL